MRSPLLQAALLLSGATAVAACSGAASTSSGNRDAGSSHTDGGPPVDTGVLPVPFEAGSVCTPGSVAGFTPSFKTPIGPNSGACTTQQLGELVDACFVTVPTPGPCNAWLMAPGNATCLQCWGWLGSAASPTWGPFVEAMSGGDELLFNLGGCIDLADPSQLPCAKATQAKLECELAACLERCGIPSNGVTTAIDQCYADADLGVCASYVAGLSVCEPPDADMNPAGFCYAAAHFQAPLLQYLSLACGPVPGADGGPDGGDGG